MKGEGEGEQADAIRDALDTPFTSLSTAEAERVRWLSEDLYSIHATEGRSPKEPNPQVMEAFQAIYEAKGRKEWDKALTLLRRWQAYLPSAQLSYLRGSLWAGVGRYDVAAEFYEHAAQLESGGNYPALHLHALAKIDSVAAEKRAHEILRRHDEYTVAAVVQAAHVAVAVTRLRSPAETRQSELGVMPVVRLAFEKIRGDNILDPECYALAASLLATAHEHLGEDDRAFEFYTQALRAAPTNADILTQRGILVYGRSPGAVTDLEQAVSYHSRVVWPYFFLAHYYLSTNRYEECRKMCERAVEFPTTDRMRSELTEWLAISEAELEFPADRVRRRFEEAIRLDPENERAKRNLATFESRVTRQQTHSSAWSWSSPATVRAFGLAEYQPDYRLAG